MKRQCGLTLGLLLGLGTLLPAEPPTQGRELTAEEQKELARLHATADRHVAAGQFEDVVKTAKLIVDYRMQRQGANHWQVIDARLLVERWQRLTGVPAQDRAEVVRGLRAAGEALMLRQRLRYREAEAALREALTVNRKVLGEGHSETALRYNELASCLQSQGRHAEALPLYRKALDVRQKVLGQQHPITAQSYNNLALCLDGQGQHAEALPLHQKALAINRMALGELHPSTANSYNSVASCLHDQGKYAEALPLYRKALTCRLKVLGEQHPSSATSYNNLADCLNDQGKYNEALPVYQKALAIRQKVLGEQHPATATSYNNVAGCLRRQANYAEALPLYRKALTIHLKVQGEQHPDTARSYNNVAVCLQSQGQYAEALPLYQKALDIYQKLLGEQHPSTATSYNNVASCLHSQGKHAEALPLHRKALVIRLKVLGEQHPDSAHSYNNMAFCLHGQGKHAEALSLYQKALSIRLKALGEQHPDTAKSYNNLAFCLDIQGRHAEALPLHQKALVINRTLLGEQHPDTAKSYNNMAFCLRGQGKHAEALSLFRKALMIYRKVLGEQHPSTAQSYHNVAFCIYGQGKYVEALDLFHKGLASRRKTLGEYHPDTAQSYKGAAACLQGQGKHAEAARSWEKALLGHECGRLQASASGFDRALFHTEYLSPRSALAACLVRLGKPVEAWQHAEADLARGLLDDLLPSAETSADADRRSRIRQLDETLLPLLTLEKPDEKQVKRRDALTKERNGLLAELAANAARRIRERVLSLPRIRQQLAPDAALVFWLDVLGDHLGCVLRRSGPPTWVQLPCSSKDNTWSNDDWSLPARTLALLADGRSDTSARQRLLAQLRRQRLAPLEPQLKGVRQLLVVPTGVMAAVPVEALTERYTISYVSSASVFARQAEQRRPLEATSLLVLADPVFTRTAPVLPPAPPHGLLILAVTPGGLAARIGLHPGDVLLEYNGNKMSTPTDLEPPKADDRVPLKLWREGKTLAGRIPAGKLGVVVDKRPIAGALAAWRKQESDLLSLGRGEWQPLPGTRLEARALAALVPKTTTLLGSDASQQKLAELAASDKLKQFRLLHLATHGQANSAQPELTALILAQDHSDGTAAAARAVLAGKQPMAGRLTVGAILADWRLDADLVVLSACQTGLGTDTRGGEGMLGFTQALLLKGARSVVLSRWKVDDAATAVLMARFYQNLLGKRQGTKPLGRAAALAEAKAWLRGLGRAEAARRLAALVEGVPRGERGSIKAALPTRKPEAPKGQDRPFAAPYFWAAFVLVGDPN